jgi:hypothetical protein
MVPEARDVPWLTDPANPTMVMGTPLPLYRVTTPTHTPLIRRGHLSPSPRVPTWTRGLPVIHCPRGKRQQQRDQICLQDGGTEHSAGSHRGHGGHVRGTWFFLWRGWRLIDPKPR